MPARLYMFELSHPSQMVRIALRMKGLPFEEHDAAGGLSPRAAAGARLSRRHGAGAEARGRPAAAVDAGDHARARRARARAAGAAPVARGDRRGALGRERAADVPAADVPLGGGSPARGRANGSSGRAACRRQASGRGSARRSPSRWRTRSAPTTTRCSASCALLPERLDRVDELLASGLIGGETLNAADLQIGCSVRTFLTFAQVAPFVEGRPCAAHARRVLPDAPEPVPLVLPEAWLPAVTGG